MSTLTKIATAKSEVDIIQMPFWDFQALPFVSKQRDHVARAPKATYLHSFCPTHLIVSAARLPNGSMLRIDGNTRVEAAVRGYATHLISKTFHVIVYEVPDAIAAKRLYDTLDTSAASKTGADQIFGAMRDEGMGVSSEWGRKAGFGSGLKMATDAWVSGKGLSKAQFKKKEDQILLFKKEILTVDSWDLKRGRFPIGVLAAAFLTLKKHGATAADFWRDHNETSGIIMNEERNSIAMLQNYLKEQKIAGTMGGMKSNQNHMHRALAYYMRNHKQPKKMFRREPTPITGRDFVEI